MQKIDGTMLDTYKIVVAAFLVTDKANQVKFFEETFLVANVSLKVVFRMLFFVFSSANIDFLDWELCWRTYITEKTLLTSRCVKLMEKKEFAAAALDLEYKTFVIHVTSLSFTPLNTDVHISYRFQISSLIAKEISTKVSNKYVNFADVFSPDLVSERSEYIGINDYIIKLVKG